MGLKPTADKSRKLFEEVATTQGRGHPRRHRPRPARRTRCGAALAGGAFALVVAMIAVGGLTRLTDSGLSITEWAPLSGAVPPLNAADWQTEFDAYRASPQYELANRGMTLTEFQFIYWWEWGHRQLGRVVGLVWAVGFVAFWATGRIPTGWTGRLVLVGALGGLQGAIGWWMVDPGLQEGMVSVASYRLATHLGLAFVISGTPAWYVLLLGRRQVDLMSARRAGETRLMRGATGLMHVAFLQIVIGALVAGIDAGRAFPTWPLMGSGFLPPDPFTITPLWRNFFEDAGLVQFIHRIAGYLLLAMAVAVWLRARRSANAATRRAFHAMLAMLLAQVAIGIVTVLWSAAVQVAIVHQLGAVVLWVLILRTRYLARYPLPQSVRGDTPMTAFADLMAFQRETEALAQIAGRLGWDQETVMPRGAADQRSEECAAIEAVLHARRTDPRIADWLAVATAPDATGAANLRLISRSYHRHTRVPARLAAEIARVTSLAQGTWAAARAAEDLAAFLPTLAHVVRLRQEEGAALAAGGDTYDALLDDYEPGATAADLGAMFGALRPRLVALRGAIRQATPAPRLAGRFDETAQLALSRELALTFGYDLDTGRIDKAVHPFSSGAGQDVRITTRTDPADPFNCIYSTIHEVGHAAYEQGIDRVHLLTPVGQGASMGVHESQSRIYENQIGRSPAFCEHLYARMRASFGDLGIADAQAFTRAVNRVSDGLIRTEADEVQYNLHVLMRFDLERALMSGDLAVSDLESAWNDRFLADFGLTVDRPSHGCLQDVHWAVGLFGYFPTYTLGNVYAGCLHAALRRDLPDLDADLARGDCSAATGWLRENVQRHGGMLEPREIIAQASGMDPTEAPLLDYLEAKFAALYDL